MLKNSGADEFLPTLIYFIIQTNPNRPLSNLQYIKLYFYN